MSTLVELLDAGGISLFGAAKRLGLTEGQALAALGEAGRATRREAAPVLEALRSWGRVRVVLRAGSCVAEVMCDLGRVRESGGWWNDEDERVHLHLDLRRAALAWLTMKIGHGSGRAVRMVSIVDDEGEVLFKVMVPREREDLIPAFQALREGGA